MKRVICRAIGFSVMAALSSGSAQAACWSDEAANSAQVREMETMLMVGALRCRDQHHDLVARYNRFISLSRPALVQANERLRAHFSASGSGLNGYDRYATSLANRYGGGAAGLNCAQTNLVLRAVQTGPSTFADLRSLANEMGVSPALPGGRCIRQIAKR